MATRPPSDAVVALRSLGRRWRSLLAGRDEDESPEDLALRAGSDGSSALDHARAATRTLSQHGRALEQILVEDGPTVHLDAADAPPARVDAGASTLEEAIAAIVDEADHLADRASRVGADEWRRQGQVAGEDRPVAALELLWAAVDTAVAELRAAERTLDEVRGRG